MLTDKVANKFFFLQLLVCNGKYSVWSRSGKIGLKGTNKLEECLSKVMAIMSFETKFQEQTGNNFKKKFVPQNGKYVITNVDDGTSDNENEDEDEGEEEKDDKSEKEEEEKDDGEPKSFEQKFPNIAAFQNGDSLQAPYAIKVSTNDDEADVMKALKHLLKQKNKSKLKSLVVGCWASPEDMTDSSSKPMVDFLVKNAKSFPNLKGLFIGDISQEESEISWITQSDLTPLLIAFPDLEYFRCKGGNELRIGPITHSKLLSLEIESGGLSKETVQGIASCKFPNLNYLEMWLGTDNYGASYSVSDLDPILDGTFAPNLKSLGLCNAELINDIVPHVLSSKIIKRISRLDVGMGTLGNRVAKLLSSLTKFPNIKELDMSYHFCAATTISFLKKSLPKVKVIADDPQIIDSFGADDEKEEKNSNEGRYVMVGE